MIETKKINSIFKNKYIELQDNIVENTKTKNIYNHIKLIENDTNYPGSVVLCKFKDKYLFINNYRYGIEKYCWELPRGYKESNESLEECAIRELKEELNITFSQNSKISKLGEACINSSIMASKIAFYLIEITDLNEIKMQKDEYINSYKWISLNEVLEDIKNGKIYDSFSINAFMFYIINI